MLNLGRHLFDRWKSSEMIVYSREEFDKIDIGDSTTMINELVIASDIRKVSE